MTRKNVLVVVDDRWNGLPEIVEKVANDFRNVNAHILYVRK